MNFLIISQIIFIIVLLFFSAFFSGSETALLKLSKIKVKHWIYTRSANAQAWANWLSNPEELITTILVGNTLVNIFFSSTMAALAMYVFSRYPQQWIQTISGCLSLILVLIFGEIVPKIYCRQNAEKISSYTLWPLFQFSRFLGTPIKKFFALLGKVFPIFMHPTPSRVSALTLDEIRFILQGQNSLTGLEKEHQEMMRKAIDLHQTTVTQIMTLWKNVDFLIIDEALSGGIRLERFIDNCVESGHTRLPVVKGHPPKVAGYLYVKDLLSCIAQQKKIDPSLCLKLLRNIPTIPPDKKISDVLDMFRFGSPIAYVQDRSGFPIGIISLEDILEEFMGEILDEYDLEEKGEGT